MENNKSEEWFHETENTSGEQTDFSVLKHLWLFPFQVLNVKNKFLYKDFFNVHWWFSEISLNLD